MLRMFRIFRIMRHESVVRILAALGKSSRPVLTSLGLCFVLMAIYAILGVNLFSHKYPHAEEYFGSFSLAFITLLGISTGDSWYIIHARAHTHTHTHTHTKHAHTQIHTRTSTRICTHKHTHTCMHACITCMCASTYEHTHAQNIVCLVLIMHAYICKLL